MVIAIIGVLVSLLLPAVHYSRETARRMSCANNQKQIALAVHNFESANKVFPSGLTSAKSSYPYMSWLAAILPNLEQKPMWSELVEDYQIWKDPVVDRGMKQRVSSYVCPSSRVSGELLSARGKVLVICGDYLGVAGSNHQAKDGVLFNSSTIRMRDIQDGTSNTLLLGERPPSLDGWYGWWYTGMNSDSEGLLDVFMGLRETASGNGGELNACVQPGRFTKPHADAICNVLGYWSFHSGGGNFAFCDGSVRFLSYEKNAVVEKMAQRSDGAVVSLED